MPVQKFRTMEEARRALWISADDPNLIPRIRQMWEFTTRIAPYPIRKGVRKFRNMTEANQERESWELERIRHYQELRKP